MKWYSSIEPWGDNLTLLVLHNGEYKILKIFKWHNEKYYLSGDLFSSDFKPFDCSDYLKIAVIEGSWLHGVEFEHRRK